MTLIVIDWNFLGQGYQRLLLHHLKLENNQILTRNLMKKRSSIETKYDKIDGERERENTDCLVWEQNRKRNI